MKKYESIIKGFNATIAKLEKLEAANAKKAMAKTERIKALKAECIDLDNEGQRALKTAEKLRSLFE